MAGRGDNIAPTQAQKEALFWLRGVGGVFALNKQGLPEHMDCPFNGRLVFYALRVLGFVTITGRVVSLTSAGRKLDLSDVKLTGAWL
jgi:hypothetical protein